MVRHRSCAYDVYDCDDNRHGDESYRSGGHTANTGTPSESPHIFVSRDGVRINYGSPGTLFIPRRQSFQSVDGPLVPWFSTTAAAGNATMHDVAGSVDVREESERT